MTEDRRSHGRRRVVIASGLALVASALVTLEVAPFVRTPGMGPGPGRHLTSWYVQLRLFISTFNVLIIGALTVSYLALYRDLATRFTGSLLLFSVALFLYAITASPVVHLLFGFRSAGALGPFTFLPDLFASLAAVVLLYQSAQ